MMNTMMNGGMSFMMSGMWLGMIFGILLLVILTWALLSWLNRSFGRPQSLPDAPQPFYSSHRYEQGYQPAQRMRGRDREGERFAQPKQEFDQPYVPYPLEQEMPPQF